MSLSHILIFQSKESSPPLSKTPSPGQSLDLVSEGRRRGKRGREEEKDGKRGKEEEERITVISITPQPMVSTRSLPPPVASQPAKKSNLRPTNRCQIFSSQSPSVAFPPPSYPPFVLRQPQPPPPPPPEYQEREEEGEEEEAGDEYQIEDIEREIQRGGEEKRESAGQNR